MNFTEFKSLIGGNIFDTYKLTEEGFNLDSESNNLYFMASGRYKYFYDMPAYYISVSQENATVDSITFYFKGIIDSSFYNAFVNEFGIPDTIQIVDNIKVISEEENTGQYLKKSFIETRDGSFEENPLYMIWNKEGYQINIFIKNSSNTSEIIFKQIIDGF